jgi:hypothetical protein
MCILSQRMALNRMGVSPANLRVARAPAGLRHIGVAARRAAASPPWPRPLHTSAGCWTRRPGACPIIGRKLMSSFSDQPPSGGSTPLQLARRGMVMLAKWTMIGGGMVFWGALVVESFALTPETLKEIIEQEEEDDRKMAAFYGLSSQVRDHSIPDTEYYAEVDMRERALRELCERLRSAPSLLAHLGARAPDIEVHRSVHPLL